MEEECEAGADAAQGEDGEDVDGAVERDGGVEGRLRATALLPGHVPPSVVLQLLVVEVPRRAAGEQQ